MRYSIILLFALAISLTSCRKDFDTVPSSGKLEFSKTTVYLDTVFTNVGSSTYMLKVYNKSNDDITIPTISLAKGEASKYRIMVDGMTGIDGPDADNIGDGKMFEGVELLANDSLFVFIEETAEIADADPTDMLYTDEILFDSGSNLQKVDLITLIQDAVFLYPERFDDGTYETLPIGEEEIYGFYLSHTDPIHGDELHFTNEKPYVIYGYAAIPPGETLIIDPGARVHFHDQSGIIVANTGSIRAIGGFSDDPILLEDEIIFEGDRLEPDFSEVPGQWGTIWLTKGSINNAFEHVTIKNASVGILMDDSADVVQIKSTQIYNSANVGILARHGIIDGENIVINNSGEYAFACNLGGTYEFKHCTFANYWTGGSRQTPAVYLDNTLDNALDPHPEDLLANFDNCIIFGPNNIEIKLNRSNDLAYTFDVNVNHCLIKFIDNSHQFEDNPLYDFVDVPNSNNNLVSNNQNPNNPKFKDTDKNNLRIGLTSAATGMANPNPPYFVAQDADGIDRTLPDTDIGAYEHLDE